MKQKFTILKNDAEDVLVIKEFAELDKEILSFLCEERFSGESIRTAMKKSKGSLITALKSQNMYPPSLYTDKIADAVISMYSPDNSSGDNQTADIFTDDLDFLTRIHQTPDISEEIEEEPDDLDDLLEEDIEDDFDDKDPINNINSPLKIADDEILDIDDEA
jgi:hypothetical protein